jgi:stage V sporulation protein G
MHITEVRIRKVDDSGRMKAIASVTFNELFVIHDLRVIEGNDGFFVAMPSRKMPNGSYKDVAHPICSKMRELIHDTIMMEYRSIPEASASE